MGRHYGKHFLVCSIFATVTTTLWVYWYENKELARRRRHLPTNETQLAHNQAMLDYQRQLEAALIKQQTTSD